MTIDYIVQFKYKNGNWEPDECLKTIKIARNHIVANKLINKNLNVTQNFKYRIVKFTEQVVK